MVICHNGALPLDSTDRRRYSGLVSMQRPVVTVRAFLRRRSPLSVVMYAIRLAGYVALFALVPRPVDPWVREVSPVVTRMLLLALALLGTGMFVTEGVRQFRAFLVSHVVVTLFVLMITPVTTVGMAVHFFLVAGAVGVHEPYPLNLIMSEVLALLVSGVHLVRWPGLHADVVYLTLVFITGSVPLCLMTLYREQIIPLQRQVRDLMANVERLTRANSLTQDYARDIEDESRQAERQRLTRDIHDLVGYTFTNAIMMTEAAKVMVRREPERIAEFMESIRSTMEDGLHEVKQSLRDLRAQDRPAESVDIAMRKLVRVFSLSTGVDVRVEYGNTSWHVLDPYGDCVYHFVQEGLINAFRHGNARSVIVFLWKHDNAYEVRLVDDGSGAVHDISEGIGLSGMRERAEAFGGSITINRIPAGFSVSMYLLDGALPCPEPSERS